MPQKFAYKTYEIYEVSCDDNSNWNNFVAEQNK